MEARPRTPPRPGFIYVAATVPITPDDPVFYKIGHSRRPRQRRGQIATGNPRQVEIIHTIASNHPRYAERHIHTMLSEARMNGEWFDLTAAELRWLKAMTRLDDPMVTEAQEREERRQAPRPVTISVSPARRVEEL